MCGILGTINLDYDAQLLQKIGHRGPDANGIKRAVCDKHLVSFAHTRLAIVELTEAGAQPMSINNDNNILSFNGEIYNHKDLRSGLNFSHFRGGSDTETLLHLLHEKGILASKDLNGIFSFAYYDANAKKVFLVRDPFGVKPLYYFSNGNAFAFCSEVKPLIELSGFKLSNDNLAQLLCLRYLPAPDTLFDGVKKLRPGHLLEIDLSGESLTFSERNYVEHNVDKLSISYADAVDEYGRKFKKAIERQLMSDVDVGVFLSGGVDSALVAKYVSDNTDYPVNAFTIGFAEQSDRDEMGYASETAKMLGMQHVPIVMGEQDFFSSMRDICSVVEEPLATTSVIPFNFLCQEAAKQLKVVLTGQGADEPLGGYGRYQGGLLLDKLPHFLTHCIPSQWISQKMGDSAMARGIAAARQKNSIDRLLASYQVFSQPEINALLGFNNDKAKHNIAYFYQLLQCNQLNSEAARMMRLDSRLNLADDLLLYTDKLSMQHSLECRVPILDHELMQFIESLPRHYKVALGRGKIIHKSFAAQVLPASIVNRRKLGFQSPTDKWFRNSDYLKQILLDNNSHLCSLVDRKEVEKLINQQDKGLSKERHLFLLLSLYFWLDSFY